MTFNFMRGCCGLTTTVPPAAPVPGWTSKNPGEAQALFATFSRAAGGAAATAAAPMTTITSKIAASRMLHGRLPTEEPADMSIWAEMVLDERTGLVVEVGAPAADVHAPSSLTSRRSIYGVRDEAGAEIGLVQILKGPAQRSFPKLPGAKGATLRVHSALAERGDSLDIQRPEYRLDHLRLRGTTSGALSPEETLEIVEYMERYRRDEPSRSVMVLGSSRGDASAQLAIAAQLYERRRGE